MTPFLSRLFFETSPFPPFLTAFLAGFVIIGADGRVYLTASGQEYLDGLPS